MINIFKNIEEVKPPTTPPRPFSEPLLESSDRRSTAHDELIDKPLGHRRQRDPANTRHAPNVTAAALSPPGYAFLIAGDGHRNGVG